MVQVCTERQATDFDEGEEHDEKHHSEVEKVFGAVGQAGGQLLHRTAEGQ